MFLLADIPVWRLFIRAARREGKPREAGKYAKRISERIFSFVCATGTFAGLPASVLCSRLSLARFSYLRADACGFGIDQVDCFFACAAGAQEGPPAGPSCESPGLQRKGRSASLSSGLFSYPLRSNLPSVREALSNEG